MRVPFLNSGSVRLINPRIPPVLTYDTERVCETQSLAFCSANKIESFTNLLWREHTSRRPGTHAARFASWYWFISCSTSCDCYVGEKFSVSVLHPVRCKRYPVTRFMGGGPGQARGNSLIGIAAAAAAPDECVACTWETLKTWRMGQMDKELLCSPMGTDGGTR